jgi:DNA-directed RNA polymerase subunit RPC12/RpoP
MPSFHSNIKCPNCQKIFNIKEKFDEEISKHIICPECNFKSSKWNFEFISGTNQRQKMKTEDIELGEYLFNLILESSSLTKEELKEAIKEDRLVIENIIENKDGSANIEINIKEKQDE